MGSSVGDSYQKVIDENGQPKSRMDAGSMNILVYPLVTIKLRDGVVVSVGATPAPSTAPAATMPAPHGSSTDLNYPSHEQLASMPVPVLVATLQALLKRAVDRVVDIINEPAPTVPLTPALGAELWGPIWFHAGAIKPDFNTVDVTKTQETADYAKFKYITSELDPGVAFPGDQLEFNSMTKFFYKDRSLPKKRLSEGDMLEINRLYRIIGKCAAQLAVFGKGAP
jgi:hypothetical protein